MISGINAIVLAAGKGSRMKSNTIKVLHQVAGKPVLQYVIDVLKHLSIQFIYVVVGYQADKIKECLQNQNVVFVEQKEQLGTGHAVKEVLPFINSKNELTLILAGDCPLIQEDTIAQMIQIHADQGASATLLTTHMSNPTGYGRIARSSDQSILGIVEEKDCSEQQRKITEINSGVYIFNTQLLLKYIEGLKSTNKQNEYYLTDMVKILNTNGLVVRALVLDDSSQLQGINTRQDLSDVYKVVTQLINQKWMNNGVTIFDPATTIIEKSVQIGEDTVIHPFTVLRGNTVIGTGCEIGPHICLTDACISNFEKV
jgi:bifunctional UDP-N-acetylglucosamine pyrophosphorylase/glucosamine-1-phosphate N-acetyltransferase